MAQKVIIYHMKDNSMLGTMVQTISKYIEDFIQNDTMTNWFQSKYCYRKSHYLDVMYTISLDKA